MTVGIYIIKNTKNNKVYVGQSIKCEERIKQHFRDLNRNDHENIYLQRSYNKHGNENFTWKIVEKCHQKNLDEREIYFIEYYKSMFDQNGFNIEGGGKSGKRRITPRMAEHSSNTRIGNKNSRSKTYVGVREKDNAWECWVSVNKNQTYYGRFSSEHDAALMHDKVTLDVYGKTFNFSKEYVESKETPMSSKNSKENKFIGVTKRTDTRRGRNKVSWRVRIQNGSEYFSFDGFETEIEAAIFRDKYIIKNNINAVKLNFDNGSFMEK